MIHGSLSAEPPSSQTYQERNWHAMECVGKHINQSSSIHTRETYDGLPSEFPQVPDQRLSILRFASLRLNTWLVSKCLCGEGNSSSKSRRSEQMHLGCASTRSIHFLMSCIRSFDYYLFPWRYLTTVVGQPNCSKQKRHGVLR